MIVYSSTKETFSDDILSNQIVEKIQNRLKRNLGHSQILQIPQTGKRIDFIVSGKNEDARDVAILKV